MPFPFGAITAVCLGVYFVISRDWISRSALQWDQEALGLQADLKWYQVGSVLWGLLLIGLGLLALSGIIELSPDL